MFSFDEYVTRLKLIKQKGRITSNNFLSMSEKKEYACIEGTSLFCTDSTVAIFVNEDDFYRLYFETVDWSDLSNILKNCDKYIVTESVGLQEQVEGFTEKLLSCGFQKYAMLTRWKSDKINVQSRTIDNIVFSMAVGDDVKEVKKLLVKIFDFRISHLPNIEKLESLMKQHMVYVAKDDVGKLVGVICFEHVGNFGLYLYQVCVDTEWQGHGISFELASFAYSYFPNKKIFSSWVENNNLASQALHKKLGFMQDRLKTVVYIKE